MEEEWNRKEKKTLTDLKSREPLIFLVSSVPFPAENFLLFPALTTGLPGLLAYHRLFFTYPRRRKKLVFWLFKYEFNTLKEYIIILVSYLTTAQSWKAQSTQPFFFFFSIKRSTKAQQQQICWWNNYTGTLQKKK